MHNTGERRFGTGETPAATQGPVRVGRVAGYQAEETTTLYSRLVSPDGFRCN